MFIENKYHKWYFNIIENAKNRTSIDGYVEKHHIIPRSFGGDNTKSNMVILLSREHFVCHKLLVKMTTGKNKQKMALALSMFLTGCRNHTGRHTVSSHDYEYIRTELSKSLKGQSPPQSTMEAAWNAKRGVPISVEQKQKMSHSLKRPISCQLIDPFDTIHFTDNLQQFCKEHNLKWNYMRQLYGKQNDTRLISEPNRGWGIYLGVIQSIGNQNAISSAAASKGWTEDRKSRQMHNAKEWRLQDPDGIIHQIISLSKFCNERNLPYTQPQAALSGTELTGKWKGWKKL